VQKGTRFAGLTSSLTKEFAWHVLDGISTCRRQHSRQLLHTMAGHLLLLLGGLRGPPKPISRMLFACACPWPLAMRACGPPGTAMGPLAVPLPLAPGMPSRDEEWRKSLERRDVIRGGLGEKGGLCGLSW
jgi:hypothetical protein